MLVPFADTRIVPSASADADRTAMAASPLILELWPRRRIKTEDMATIGMENSSGARPAMTAIVAAPKAT